MGLKRDSSYLFVGSMVELVTATLASILVARALGTEGKGILYLLMLLPSFVVGLGGMGLRASAVYFAGRGTNLASLGRILVSAGLVLGTVYLGAGYLARGWLERVVLQGLQPEWILLALAMIPFMLFRAYGDGILQGVRRFDLFVFVQSASGILRLLLLVLGLMILDQGLLWAIWTYVASAVVPALITMVMAARIFARNVGTEATPRDVVRYGLAGHVGNLAQRANLRLDVFILNPYVGPSGVGIYSVATMLGQLSWHIPNALGQALLPKVAGATPREAGAVTALLSRVTLAMALALTGTLVLLSSWLIRWLFTEDFLGAVPALYWLAPGLVALSVSKIVTKYLAGVGRPELNSLASFGALAVNLPLLFWLVPSYGIVGASAATSAAYIVQTCIVLHFFVRETGRSLHQCLLPRPSDAALVRGIARDLLSRTGRPGSDRRPS